MYNVLLVDDEKSILNGLVEFFNWDEAGCNIVGAIDSGKEAYNFIIENSPHIVITDVKMVDISGIDLMAKAIQAGSDTKFIFISGYDNFDYCKTALKMGAVSYILKPIVFSELADELTKCIQIIKKEQQGRILDRLLNNNKEEITSGLLNSLLKKTPGYFDNKFQIDYLDYFLHYKKYSRFSICVVDLKNRFYNKEIKNDLYGDLSLKRAIVKRILGEALRSSKLESIVFESSIYVLSLIMIECPERADADIIREIMLKVQSTTYDETSIMLNIGIGGFIDNFTNIGESFAQALASISNNEVSGRNEIITSGRESEREGFNNLQYYHYIQSLSEYALNGDIRKLSDEMESVSHFFEGKPEYYIFFKNLAVYVIVMINNLLIKYNMKIGEDEFLSVSLINEIEKYNNISDIKNLIINCISNITRKIEDLAQQNNMKLINDIKGFIEEHYSEPIDLSAISKQFFISQSYICELFKNNCKLTFKKYITLLRLENAKKLLIAGNKVNIVAINTGYDNASYFSQIFKEYTGYSPSEYQMQFMGGSNP